MRLLSRSSWRPMYRGFVLTVADLGLLLLLCVTPPLSQPASCRIFNCPVNKAKGPKKYTTHNKLGILLFT